MKLWLGLAPFVIFVVTVVKKFFVVVFRNSAGDGMLMVVYLELAFFCECTVFSCTPEAVNLVNKKYVYTVGEK